jgi:endonuclease/exonuclease/phosphatase (EEP) superfamily protein YafD
MPTDLGHQRVQIDINGQTVTLFNLHPVHPGVIGKGFDPSWRAQEIAALLEETRAYQPVMMAGDFNMPELSEDYARITQGAGFTDAYRARGWGLGHTFTHHVLPFLRLDYVFLGNGLDVSASRVWDQSGGSDHLPVLSTLVLKP